MTHKKLLTAHEMAGVLGLSVDTIWRYTRENRIPHIEVGPRQYRYEEDSVLLALNKKVPSTVQEEAAEYAVKTKLTYSDYAKLPHETGYTIQLIDGCIVRDPSTTFMHQRVSSRLLYILMTYFQELDPKGEVFPAPLDIFLNEHTVVQPDILYLPSTRPAIKNPVDSLPELVVEITSPSTAKTDRIQKLNSYLKAGIPHYWIVDPDDGFMECFELQDARYVLLLAINEGTFNHPSFPGLTFEMEALFAW